ncbi:MAG: hypothetical protein Kow0031_37850 [Anaerolineae bacterium]
MKRFSERFRVVHGVNFIRYTPTTSGGHASRRNPRTAALSLALLLALMLTTTAIALAVHNNGFELDSNAVDDPAGSPDDWQNIFQGNSSAAATTGIVHDGDNPPRRRHLLHRRRLQRCQRH